MVPSKNRKEKRRFLNSNYLNVQISQQITVLKFLCAQFSSSFASSKTFERAHSLYNIENIGYKAEIILLLKFRAIKREPLPELYSLFSGTCI